MRSRTLRITGASVTALALAASLAGTASAGATGISPSHKGSAATVVSPDAKTCYSNLEGDTGVALTSQNFESDFDVYDAQLADDVTTKKKCTVKEITVIGAYYNGSGPAESVNVWFYKDKDGAPGKVVSEQTVTGEDNAGSFVLPLDKVKLKKKSTYWVSVQVNMDFAVGGQWGWENTTNQKGDQALFQNPGDGFVTGCTDWAPAIDCFAPDAPGADFMFELGKK